MNNEAVEQLLELEKMLEEIRVAMIATANEENEKRYITDDVFEGMTQGITFCINIIKFRRMNHGK